METSIISVVFGVFVGLIIACVLSFLNIQILGECVRRLLSQNANTPESAKSLAELNLRNIWLFKLALRKQGTFRHIVYESPSQEGVFYIDEKNIYRAERNYVDRKISLFQLIILVLVLFISMIIIAHFIPEIIGFATNLISTIKESAESA